MFIVVEGADAVGKNTLTGSLVKWFENDGRQAVKISFPRYETPVGKIIRAHLMNMVSLTASSASDHSKEPDMVASNDLMFQCLMLADKVDAASAIQKDLADGKIVIADRYWQSAYVYGCADGLSKDWLLRTHELLPKADVNILLDLAPEEAAARRPQYRDRYERDREKMAAVRQGYIELWDRHLDWDHIDASLPPEMVLNLAKGLVKNLSQAK